MRTKNIRDGLSVFCKSMSFVGNTRWLEMILCLGIHLELCTRRLKYFLFMCIGFLTTQMLEYPKSTRLNFESHSHSGHTRSVQFSSVTQLCLTPCDPMNCSTPGLPVHHQLPEFTQTHVHRLRDAIQPVHPLPFPSPLAPSPSQNQSLFQ